MSDRTGMSTTNLQSIIDEQKTQLESYEKKLKDVVNAYKSLQNEKKALEIAVGTLSGDNANAGSSNASATPDASGSEPEAPSPLEALKQALTTLTVENKKKELAFQSDRKALLAKNEKLQTMIDSMQMNASKTKDVTKYKEQLRRMEEEKEKLIADHGAVLAAMQKRYAEEAAKVKNHEKTITELYTQIHTKDQQIQANAAIVSQFEKLQDEMLRWKKRAEQTPREEMLLQEITNLKKSHQEELELERNKRQMTKSVESGLDLRVRDLEHRLTELTQKNASFEHERFELRATIEELEKTLAHAALTDTPENKDDSSTLANSKNPKLTFVKLYQKLKMTENFDLYETLGIERTSPPQVDLSPNRATSPKNDAFCDKCDASTKDLTYFKSVINHLQKQLRLLEESQTANKSTNEEMIVSLRKRITELETAQQRTYNELTTETKRRVSELEDEMKKQRERMQQIIAEKDREIEIARNSLSALYAQKNGTDPVDPQPKRSSTESVGGPLVRQRNSAESVRSVLAASFDEDTTSGFRSPIRRTISNHYGDTPRNVFYEQEITKYEHEILELRNMVRMLEMKIGDMEQESLTKDMRYLEIIETLKEEIRVLEGRLTLHNSNENFEYLRNIFVQFLKTTEVKARKYMLRAIAGVLKLTPTEIRHIDSFGPG